MKEYMDLGEDESDELINRENVWHFYAYFAENAAQMLHEFMEIAEIPDKSKGDIRFGDHPLKVVGNRQFHYIKDALDFLTDYYKQMTCHLYIDGMEYNSCEINFERGDSIVPLLDGLHMFVNILPYLNSRNYVLSKEKYEEERHHRYTFEELQNLDRTLAKTILPTFIWFANHSIYTPKHLVRLYMFPKLNGKNPDPYNSWEHWNKCLSEMVESWEWLRDRNAENNHNKWESVPDEIYYGLHLFAEYLPEMQND